MATSTSGQAQSVTRNELPLPIELLYDILGDVLSSYLHDEMFESTQPRWDAFTASIATSFTFKELTVDILRLTFDIPEVENMNHITAIRKKLDILRQTSRLESLTGVNPLIKLTPLRDPEAKSWIWVVRDFSFPEPRSVYFDCYHLYYVGIETGRLGLKNFDPVSAGLRTWAVDKHQLSPGVGILANAFRLCQHIVPRCMSRTIEAKILNELIHQLIVRQFQVWRWCLIRACYLLPISTADVRQDVDSSITKLLHRVSHCEDLRPVDLGYYADFEPIPWEKVAHVSKATRRNLEESNLFSTLEKLSLWQDTEPGYEPPWKGTMNNLVCRWREVAFN